LIIESDLLVAHSKTSDWLKPQADLIFERLRKGSLSLSTSAAALIELYYVLEDFGIDKGSILGKQAELAGIEGLTILPLTAEVILAAQSVMRTFRVPGLFDGLYAAATLNQDREHKILSTDEVYDRVPGIQRVDPRSYTP
jgi:predicted nucleic acid-binding protein